MRRRFARARGRKRSVAWIPGFSSFDQTNGTAHRLLSFAQVPLVSNVWSVAAQLTVDADLTLHGGEDAVIERIRGRLAFVEGRKNAGAGLAAFGFQVRLVVAQVDIAADPAAVTYNQSFISSAELGQDNMLWSYETVVTDTAIGAAGAGFANMTSSLAPWVDVDIRAKRKLQSNSQIVFYMQTVLPGGTTGADCRMLGGLRMLLKTPR